MPGRGKRLLSFRTFVGRTNRAAFRWLGCLPRGHEFCWFTQDDSSEPTDRRRCDANRCRKSKSTSRLHGPDCPLRNARLGRPQRADALSWHANRPQRRRPCRTKQRRLSILVRLDRRSHHERRRCNRRSHGLGLRDATWHTHSGRANRPPFRATTTAMEKSTRPIMLFGERTTA